MMKTDLPIASLQKILIHDRLPVCGRRSLHHRNYFGHRRMGRMPYIRYPIPDLRRRRHLDEFMERIPPLRWLQDFQRMDQITPDEVPSSFPIPHFSFSPTPYPFTG
jgi:hypothetical protein